MSRTRNALTIGMSCLAFAACAPAGPSGPASILLFAGTGTSPGDVAAVKTILIANHLDFATATSAQLNGMGESQLMAYRLMIIPGGNFIAFGENLTTTTTANLRNAVHGGLNYLGLCGGAFFAGQGGTHYNSLDLTSGVRFEFYSAERAGTRKAAVAIETIGTPTLDQYWEDGPQLSGWGAVVAKYPDGTPAVAQGTSGKGWVVLSGIHPEAPDNWRGGMGFTTPASVDNAYALTLIEAALEGKQLPHY